MYSYADFNWRKTLLNFLFQTTFIIEPFVFMNMIISTKKQVAVSWEHIWILLFCKQSFFVGEDESCPEINSFFLPMLADFSITIIELIELRTRKVSTGIPGE